MSDIILEQTSKQIIIETSSGGGGAGNDGRGITDAAIVGNDLVLTFDKAPLTENVGRVVGFNGTNGTNGTNGATWFQGSGAPSSGLGVNGDFYLNTANEDISQKQSGTWVVIANIKGDKGDKGDTGNTGATGADGPSSLLPFINKPSFIDHLMPIGTNGGVFTTNFQGLVRSGSGTVAFRNNQTIGGSGQITLSKGVNGSSDLVIRRSSGLSGARIGTTPIDYVFCFYADNLPTSIDNSVLRLCAQNDATASITPSNRTGFYVDFGWSVDGVKATFSCFNNTVSTVIVDTLSLAAGTLYAVRVRVSSTTAQLYINGVLRQTINTNLPVFAPIQMGVGLARTGGGVVISYTVDALASEAIEPQNNYVL
jgi:hypothetical protein